MSLTKLPSRPYLVNMLRNKAEEFDIKLDYRAINNLEILELHRILSYEDEDTKLAARQLILFMINRLACSGFRMVGLSLVEYVWNCYSKYSED